MDKKTRYYAMPYTQNASSDKAFKIGVHYEVPEDIARKNGWIDQAPELVFAPSDGCPALTKLADEIENRTGRSRKKVIRLLRHMASHPRATFEELRKHIHDEYHVEDSTIERNIRETQKEIRLAELPIHLSTSESKLRRIDTNGCVDAY